MVRFDIEAAIEKYYSQHELSTKDIMEIFGCSRSRADALKKQVREAAAKAGVRPLVFDVHNVQAEYAFEVWGLDIDELEKKHKKLHKFYKTAGRGEDRVRRNAPVDGTGGDPVPAVADAGEACA